MVKYTYLISYLLFSWLICPADGEVEQVIISKNMSIKEKASFAGYKYFVADEKHS